MTDSGKERMRKSRQQERDSADAFGGKRNAYSGSRWEKPGDVVTGENFASLGYLMVECKRTNSTTQITIKKKDLRKNEQEAAAEGRIGVLDFSLGDDEYILTRRDDYIALLDAVQQAGGLP